MADKRTEEQNDAEEQGGNSVFVDYAQKAIEEHLDFNEKSIVPGFVCFVSDTDVYLGLYEFTLNAGAYFLKVGEDAGAARVYMMTFDADELASMRDGLPYVETTDKDGNTMRSYHDPVSFSAKMEPVQIKDGEYLTYLEYAAWLAITVAPDDETRDAIFKSAYQMHRKETPEREEPPKQDGGKPTWRHDPITKLAQSLSNPALYGDFGTVTLNVAGKADRKRKRSVETVVSLEYFGDNEDVSLSRPISEFDLQVLNGYIAQVAAGRTMFTATDVFEAVTGAGKPTKKQLQEFTESIDRMRYNRLIVDMTQEAEAHGLVDPETGKPWKSWKVESVLVPADKSMLTSKNGRYVEGYMSRGEPVVYTHARMTNQMVSYPLRYLETKDAGSNTQQNLIMRAYLLKRILQARDNPRMRPTIKYSTIYEKAGVDKENRTARKRANDYIEALLKIWIEKGLISDYEIEREKLQISKVTVFFPQ